MPPATVRQPAHSLLRRNDDGELLELSALAGECARLREARQRRGRHAPLIVAVLYTRLREALIETELFREHSDPYTGGDVTLHVHADMRLRHKVYQRNAGLSMQDPIYFHAEDLNEWYDSLPQQDPETSLMLVFISTTDARRAGWRLAAAPQLSRNRRAQAVVHLSDDEEDQDGSQHQPIQLG
ncbi:hypothetical protein QIS74_04989 [Colletotrichum tabaci]|uniref:Uncharacterized protein n=1 Tax=Colletotrichum tabaci TaxID=1209068 RepID=A0AAV9TH47_9PEZI